MALFNVNATISEIGQMVSGKSQSGKDWQKQTVIISCEGAREPYDKIVVTAFGDICTEVGKVKVGDKVKATISICAREYNGKHYNDVSIYSLNLDAPAQTVAPAPAPAESLEPQKEDLPF